MTNLAVTILMFVICCESARGGKMHPKSDSSNSFRLKRNSKWAQLGGYESTSDFWRNEAQKKVKFV